MEAYGMPVIEQPRQVAINQRLAEVQTHLRQNIALILRPETYRRLAAFDTVRRGLRDDTASNGIRIGVVVVAVFLTSGIYCSLGEGVAGFVDNVAHAWLE